MAYLYSRIQKFRTLPQVFQNTRHHNICMPAQESMFNRSNHPRNCRTNGENLNSWHRFLTNYHALVLAVVEKCVNVCNFPWLLSNAYDKETGRRLAEVRHLNISSGVHTFVEFLHVQYFYIFTMRCYVSESCAELHTGVMKPIMVKLMIKCTWRARVSCASRSLKACVSVLSLPRDLLLLICAWPCRVMNIYMPCHDRTITQYHVWC